MAKPSTRQEFKDYCKRRLGYPVINIEVDDEQIEDRIDDALAKFRDYHYDGSEHVYYRHIVTQQDKDNEYITLPEEYFGVISVFDIGDSINSSNLFNDLFDFSSATYAPYVMAMRHVETLEEIFVGKKPIRFSRHTDKLYIDMDWKTDVLVGEYIIIDCYRSIEPDTYSDAWNDSWLKRYATALIKQQWGSNIKKFEGMSLPGNVQFNGQKIWEEATDEITKLEEELINNYMLPPEDMMN
jgi:hypothetical protein